MGYPITCGENRPMERNSLKNKTADGCLNAFSEENIFVFVIMFLYQYVVCDTQFKILLFQPAQLLFQIFLLLVFFSKQINDVSEFFSRANSVSSEHGFQYELNVDSVRF